MLIYSFYEMQRVALQPVRALAEVQSAALRLPYLPLNYTPAARY